jgi:hypothetical protein
MKSFTPLFVVHLQLEFTYSIRNYSSFAARIFRKLIIPIAFIALKLDDKGIIDDFFIIIKDQWPFWTTTMLFHH